MDPTQFLTDEKLKALFDQFDIYNSGMITTKELKVAFSKFGREISTEDIV